jgi:hypothetical protein
MGWDEACACESLYAGVILKELEARLRKSVRQARSQPESTSRDGTT